MTIPGMCVLFSVVLLDFRAWKARIPPLVKQFASLEWLEARPGWLNDCISGSSMRNVDRPSTKEPSEDDKRRLVEWARSFVPTETAIDGGLFPARLRNGMFWFENYADFELAGEHAEMPELDAETAAKIEHLFGGPIEPKERLKR